MIKPHTDTTSRTYRMLRAMWTNWAISVGALSTPILAALILPKLWIAPVCVVAAYILISLRRAHWSSPISTASLIRGVTVRSLLITALAMFVIAVLCTDYLVPTVIHLDLYNHQIPFITCLILFPVTAVMCCLTLYTGLGTSASRRSLSSDGLYVGDSSAATMYYRECRYQVNVLLGLSILLAIIEYWYYFARYINTDMSRPDRFFFNYIPLAIYLISLIFMAGRYASLESALQALEDSMPGLKEGTAVRFLILHGNEVLLRRSEEGTWDTPAQCVIERTRRITDDYARRLLDGQQSLPPYTLRYLYTGEGFAEGVNVIHYAAILPEDTEISNTGQGENDSWWGAYMLDIGLTTGTLAPALAAELYRIHTITMAWKTYDHEGKRLYPIRHYRPTFRLADLNRWTVDYDDSSWFDVATYNEDRRFWRLRRAWLKAVSVLSKD